MKNRQVRPPVALPLLAICGGVAAPYGMIDIIVVFFCLCLIFFLLYLQEWEAKGHEVVASYVEKYGKKAGGEEEADDTDRPPAGLDDVLMMSDSSSSSSADSDDDDEFAIAEVGKTDDVQDC